MIFEIWIMLILIYGLKYNVRSPVKTVKHSLTFWYIFDSTVHRHLQRSLITLNNIHNLWRFGVTVTVLSDHTHNYTSTKRLQIEEGKSKWVNNTDKICNSLLEDKEVGIHKSRKHLGWRHFPQQYISHLWNIRRDIFHLTRQLKILKALFRRAAKS